MVSNEFSLICSASCQRDLRAGVGVDAKRHGYSPFYWWWTTRSAGPGQLTRIDFCNRRASPLTSQDVELYEFYWVGGACRLGISCRAWRFLPGESPALGKKKPALSPAPVFVFFAMGRTALRRLPTLHDVA